MAEVQAATVEHDGKEIDGEIVNEATALKDKMEELKRGTDLPQDYLPFSPSATNVASPRAISSKECPPNDSFAANAHTWVSPNKSSEVSSSKDSTPDALPEPIREETGHQDIQNVDNELNTKDSIYSFEADLETEYEADFEAIVTDEIPDLDLSIVGEGLEIQKKVEIAHVEDDEEAVLDVTRKDIIKVNHGDKHIILVLPSEVRSSCPNSTSSVTISIPHSKCTAHIFLR